jgi:very-short-patch-repair endonuclease
MGWQVIRIWQHQILADLHTCIDRIVSTVEGRRHDLRN